MPPPRLQQRDSPGCFGRIEFGHIQQAETDAIALVIAQMHLIEPIQDHGPVIGGRHDEGDWAWRSGHDCDLRSRMQPVYRATW
jgi:hypothetical protein